MVGIKPLSRAGGAEVTGLDLTRPPAPEVLASLQRALGENGILLFRGANLTPEQHIAFSRAFGPLETHVVGEFNLAGHPEIFIVSNVKEEGKLKGAVYAGQYWHSDLSYMAKPSMGSLLLCLEMPEIGGDTMWANMVLAYETLSDAMKGFLGGLKAIHDYSHAYDTYFAHLKERPPLTAEQRAKTPPVAHPMVRTHPVTGRKALYVNPGFTTGIVGMPKEESQPILEFLFRHSTRPEFVYRHKWRVHDMIFWDNRCTMHYALSDYDFSVRRHMHRTTVAGDAPY
ncbi:MAG TPA: TauD/TfdA family dioxygenase [Burkholderiales bacterium]|jgi:taurine dioxygenase|nr:TauD/TfdA family dioxygenase [Burkholderiales bacterium]